MPDETTSISTKIDFKFAIFDFFKFQSSKLYQRIFNLLKTLLQKSCEFSKDKIRYFTESISVTYDLNYS